MRTRRNARWNCVHQNINDAGQNFIYKRNERRECIQKQNIAYRNGHRCTAMDAPRGAPLNPPRPLSASRGLRGKYLGCRENTIPTNASFLFFCCAMWLYIERVRWCGKGGLDLSVFGRPIIRFRWESYKRVHLVYVTLGSRFSCARVSGIVVLWVRLWLGRLTLFFVVARELVAHLEGCACMTLFFVFLCVVFFALPISWYAKKYKE